MTSEKRRQERAAAQADKLKPQVQMREAPPGGVIDLLMPNGFSAGEGFSDGKRYVLRSRGPDAWTLTEEP